MSTAKILRKVYGHISQFEYAGDRKAFKRLNYFRRSMYGIRICLEIMKIHFEKNDNFCCTKEYLTKKMASLASRATIINFLNDEISKGSLEITISKQDRRVKNIKPSTQLIQEFTLWIDSNYRPNSIKT